jgi:hypothetical protein
MARRGEPRPKIFRHTETINGEVVRLYGATEVLDNYFTGLTPDAAAVEGTRTEAVAATTVRRFPGDLGYSRSGHSRVKSTVASQGGNALPGRRFWCERQTGVFPNVLTTVEQFNYEGSFRNLVALARASAFGQSFKLRNSSGKWKLVTVTP